MEPFITKTNATPIFLMDVLYNWVTVEKTSRYFLLWKVNEQYLKEIEDWHTIRQGTTQKFNADINLWTAFLKFICEWSGKWQLPVTSFSMY